MDIKSLLSPASCAVVGATDRPGAFGNHAAQNALLSSIGQRVYLVSTTRDQLFGRPCYKSLSDLPEAPDCVVLCTPKETVVSLLEEAGRLGVRSAVIYASGFDEVPIEEAHQLEQRLLAVAKKHDLAVIGPNCIGFVNNIDQIALWTMGKVEYFGRRPAGLGLAAHSGFMTGNVLTRQHIPLSYGVSVGNANVVTIEDVLAFYAHSPQVGVIGAYLESVKKPEVFEGALAAAAAASKPVVILKGGRTAAGIRAARHHTGNRAEDVAGFMELARRYGVIVARDVTEYAEAVTMFSVLGDRFPQCQGIAGLNFSGGENVVSADLAADFGLIYPEFQPDIAAAIDALIPYYATVANPLDGTTGMGPDPAKKVELLRLMASDPAVGLVAVGANMGTDKSPRVESVIGPVVKAAQSGAVTKPMIIVPAFEASRNTDYREWLARHHIPVLAGGQAGFSLLRHLMNYAAFRQQQAGRA